MSTCSENKKRVSKIPGGRSMKQILPALAAVSSACGLVAAPALALELGEVTVESKLGQPLRASIAYALQPHEQLQDYCVSLKPGPTPSGLPGLSRAKISVGNGAIRLTGSIPIQEPVLGLQVSINCPYTPNLLREYAMLFDFSTPLAGERAPARPAAAPTATRSTGNRPGPRTATVSTSAPLQAIAPASRYQVQPGDSLSGIVARINDRPPGLWPAVKAVFDANPQAFIDGNIDLIKSGSSIVIPDLYQALGETAAIAATANAQPQLSPLADTAGRYDGPAALPVAPPNDFSSGYTGQPAPVEDVVAETSSGTSASTETTTPADAATQGNELRPGDILPGDDSPFVSPIESGRSDTAVNVPTVVIPDTSIPVRSSDAQPAPAEARGTVNGSWSWLAWLGGAGVAVFLGLLLFGRQVRQKFGSTPIGDAQAVSAQRRRAEPERRAAVPAPVDFAFDNVASDSPFMSLDADLGLGTGLRRSTDIDVVQDFGFSARHDFAEEFDLEFPEAAADEPEQQATDIIPPHRMAEPSILESEIPPSDDDDEYDLSMIVDATRQPIIDTHLTAKDLKAVPVGTADDDDEAEYTLDREIDYKILEQDYQEEFTTTQALNEEIARAAMELAETMSGNRPLDETSELPRYRRAAAQAVDRTAELPGRVAIEITAELTGKVVAGGDAVNDDVISDLDDTGINEELTAELPQDKHDVTAEMAIEGGRIDTRKTRVS